MQAWISLTPFSIDLNKFPSVGYCQAPECAGLRIHPRPDNLAILRGPSQG